MGQQVATTPSDVCTRVCTSNTEIANAGDLDAGRGTEAEGIDQADPLAAIAALLAGLSPTDRARLAKMLTG
jgi:hypothetical protein